MGAYEPLYTLRIAHDYFDNDLCRAIVCRITSSGAELMRRRGMLFKRTAYNEWAILYDISGAAPDTGADLLSFELHITDMNFVAYTCWPNFYPDAAYRLDLPAEGGDIEAGEGIAAAERRRKIGSGFCDMRLALTEETLAKAQSAAPPCCTIRFHAPRYRWEYIFLTEHGSAPDIEALRLETANGETRYHFPAFERVREFDRDAYRTVSDETIPLRERYGFRLCLCASTADGRRKRTIMRDVPPPIPGRHPSAPPGLIRQVCCI